MQNYIYNGKNTFKLLDIRSEKLYREAEDCFFYFSKSKAALKKLNLALEYCPNHYKSLILSGDIHFLDGNCSQALKQYAKAYEIKPMSARACSSISNTLNELGFYSEALLFCEHSFELLNNPHDELISSLYELKISILTNQKRYLEAKTLLEKSSDDFEYLRILKQIKLPAINKKINIQAKLQHSKIHLL